jgi:hypothetical protein
MASRPPLHDVACVLHLHSVHSDGTGTVAEIAAAARRAGAEVVLLTDHDSFEAKRRGEEGWHGDVLVLAGEEISPIGENHLLAFGIDEEVRHEGLSAAEIAAGVAEAGGIGFAAHPWSAGNSRFPRYGTGMPWRDLDAPSLTGVELWSFLTDTAEALRGYGDAARFVIAPGRVLEHPPRRNLEAWDRLCASRRVVALGGLDAHQLGKRIAGRVPLRLMSYARSFRQLRTHVLCEQPLAGGAAEAGRQVYAALREGRCYLAVDALAPARGFAFWAERPGSENRPGDLLAMGAEAPAGEWLLRVSAPCRAELRLLRDGELAARAPAATSLGFRAEGPGVFRVEARLEAHGRARTWIVSNPIYLRAALAL